MSQDNAGVTSSRIKFCDLKCKHASFPVEEHLDGSKNCRIFVALWRDVLHDYITKNALYAVQFGRRRPKTAC